MVSKIIIESAIKEGVIRFCIDPNLGRGTVCRIGDSWFYFGGATAEELSPEEYVNNVPLQDIVDEIYDTLEAFSREEDFVDEYEYYEYIIIYENGDSREDGVYKNLLQRS